MANGETWTFMPWTFRLARGDGDLVHITMEATRFEDMGPRDMQINRVSFCEDVFFDRFEERGTPVTCMVCITATPDIHRDGVWLEGDYAR
jgi:hypothetical protein